MSQYPRQFDVIVTFARHRLAGGRGVRGYFAYMLILLACSLATGCAQWTAEQNSNSDSILPPPQTSPDSVTIETVLVRFPLESEADLQQVWQTADESVFDIEVRKRLDKNGLRAGVLIGEIPEMIRQQLTQTSVKQATDALEHAGLAADVDNKMRQLHCRAGRRKDLVVRREILEPLTVVTTFDGRLAGETYERATALFDLRVVPHANGQATIHLTPEIQHGDHQQSFVSTEYGVRPEIKRKQATWQELAIDAKLSKGQILMVSCTIPQKALGRALFLTKTAEQTEEHVILLIRLAETQMDELFSPEEIEKAHALTER